MLIHLRRFLKPFRSRPLYDWEWRLGYSEDMAEISFNFHVKRLPWSFELFLSAGSPVRPQSLEFKFEEESSPIPIDFDVAYQNAESGLEIHVFPKKSGYITTAILRVSGTDSETPFQARVLGERMEPQDLREVLAAHRYFMDDDHDSALSSLHQYEKLSRGNAMVNSMFCRTYRAKGDHDKSEEYALRTIVAGDYDTGSKFYREIQDEDRGAVPAESVRDLQKASAEWEIRAHRGVLVLERNQRFLLGLEGWHLHTCRETLEVRRAAAARMMRSRGFQFSANNESLLHTTLRVIHKNDEIEVVPLEYFTVSDSSSHNIFITVENERSGQWILPDLEAGDIVELTYHLIRQEAGIQDKTDGFILTSLYDNHNPTYRAVAEFVVPATSPIRFATRNLPGTPEDHETEGGKSTIFSGSRFVPSKYTGVYFEENYLNPLISCSSEGISWADVAATSMKVNFGDAEVEDELPDAIRAVFEGDGGREGSLERAFYWIRDKLKYASLKTGAMRVGKEARAREILEAGTADCKDRAFLLSLVCRDLEIPFEYVAISTKNGITIKELPAQQFDHVFVRVKIENGWVYLDPTNSMSPFGSAPAWCQGLDVMILDEKGTIVTIPTDRPEQNTLVMSETFSTRTDGLLDGTFEFQARGHSGRSANERWKAVSLSLDDQDQAAQEGLRVYMPASIVSGCDRISDTGSSGLFHVSGNHRRCTLVELGRQGDQIGRLTWEVPTLPISYWRMLQLDRLFAVEFPIRIELKVTLEGEVLEATKDHSLAGGLDNGICSISETVTREDLALTIHRVIEFKKKTVEGADIAEVPHVFEEIEKALNLVVAFRGP